MSKMRVYKDYDNRKLDGDVLFMLIQEKEETITLCENGYDYHGNGYDCEDGQCFSLGNGHTIDDVFDKILDKAKLTVEDFGYIEDDWNDEDAFISYEIMPPDFGADLLTPKQAKRFDIAKNGIEEHSTVEGWTYWTGSNWHTIITHYNDTYNTADFEEVTGSDAKIVLREFRNYLEDGNTKDAMYMFERLNDGLIEYIVFYNEPRMYEGEY